MSSQAAAGGKRELLPWVGHYAFQIQCVAISFTIASTWLPPDTPARLLSTLSVVCLIGGFTAQRAHDHSLCDKCIQGWPLDPQAVVTAKDRHLRFFHRVADWVGYGSWSSRLFRLLAPVFVVSMVLTFLPDFPSNVVSTLVNLFVLYAVWTARTHWDLEPWCPYCRDHGGGDDTFNPEPVTPPAAKIKR